MLKKRYKLNSKEIKFFFNSKINKKISNNFIIYSLNNKIINSQFTKYAFIIKKKIVKKSVERNKVKRIFFNYLKENQKQDNNSYIFLLKNKNFNEKEIKNFF